MLWNFLRDGVRIARCSSIKNGKLAKKKRKKRKRTLKNGKKCGKWYQPTIFMADKSSLFLLLRKKISILISFPWFCRLCIVRVILLLKTILSLRIASWKRLIENISKNLQKAEKSGTAEKMRKKSRKAEDLQPWIGYTQPIWSADFYWNHIASHFYWKKWYAVHVEHG